MPFWNGFVNISEANHPDLPLQRSHSSPIRKAAYVAMIREHNAQKLNIAQCTGYAHKRATAIADP